MNAKIIGIKEFRANISQYAQEAQDGEDRYIIMNRNKPLFELKPFREEQDLMEVLSEIIEAEKDMRAGRLHTEKEVMKEFS